MAFNLDPAGYAPFPGFDHAMDLDEDGTLAGGPPADRTLVLALVRAWLNERHAPDLLRFRGAPVERALVLLGEQADLVARLRGAPGTSEDEHFMMMLVQTEAERVRFVVRAYLRTRLWKIERYAPHILNSAALHPRLSAMELEHATKFGTLLAAQFHGAVLAALPPTMRALNDEMPNMPSMITRPDREQAVFVHARADCEPVRLPDGEMYEIKKGSISLLRYRTVEALLERGDVELV